MRPHFREPTWVWLIIENCRMDLLQSLQKEKARSIFRSCPFHGNSSSGLWHFPNPPPARCFKILSQQLMTYILAFRRLDSIQEVTI